MNFVKEWKNKLDDNDIIQIIKMCSEALIKEKTDHINRIQSMEIEKIYQELEK